MSSPAISVEHLSKAYRIGVKEEIPDTLMGAMKNVITAPWKNFKALRRLNTFGTDPQSPVPAPQSPLPNPLSESDTLWALRDVSFEINQGDVVGIIGRNGAGKSTLLKILSRITEPTSGRAVIRGRVSSLLEVGTGFHPELTGRENVYMNGTILGMMKKEIDRKFDEIVEFSGVEKFLDTPTKRYSSGMQVRLAFAVAAHLEPEILIIDEVLAVGDVEFQKKCLGKMKDVADGGRTVLFVSHNMAAVQSLCNVGILIKEGFASQKLTISKTMESYLDSEKRSSRYDLKGTTLPAAGACILSAAVESASNDSVTLGIKVGSPIAICVKCYIAEPLREVSLGVGFDLVGGSRILTLHSTHGTDIPRNFEVGTHEFKCNLEQLNLYPGKYLVTIKLETNNHSLDLKEHAFLLEVLPSDFYGNGSRLFHAAVLTNENWNIP